jgi:hypothetical protein
MKHLIFKFFPRRLGRAVINAGISCYLPNLATSTIKSLIETMPALASSVIYPIALSAFKITHRKAGLLLFAKSNSDAGPLQKLIGIFPSINYN